MKRSVILLATFLPGCTIYGQKGHQYQVGMELGGYYSPGLTFMKSSTMSADPQLTYSSSNYAGSFGGRIGLQYIAKDPSFITFGLAYELGQSSVGMDISKMDLSASSIATYSKKLNGKIFQQSLLIQVTPHLGSYGQVPLYIEGGLQFNTVTKMQETNSIDNADFKIHQVGYQIKDEYRPFAKNILDGAGMESGLFRLGIRFSFPLDAITKDGYLPVQDGVYDLALNNPNYAGSYRKISGLKLTGIQLTLQIHFLAVAAGRCDLGKKGFQAFPLKFRESYFWKMSNF
jgi:hypothetical protein